MNVGMFAVPAVAALAVIGVGACSGQTMTVTHTVTETTPAQSPTAPADTGTGTATEEQSPTSAPANTPSSVPVLSPGESATFSVGNTYDSQIYKMTWTMGSHVATAPDTFPGPGYQDIAFNLKIQNEGPAINGDPTSQSFMVWRGTDGKTDESLASTGATEISSGTQGITGQNLGLLSGIPANGYASGYLELLVPRSPGAAIIVDPNTDQPVLIINYDKLSSDQISSFERRLQVWREPYSVDPHAPQHGPCGSSDTEADLEPEYRLTRGRDSAVNAGLPALGVRAAHGQDEYETIGLARHQYTAGWTANP